MLWAKKLRALIIIMFVPCINSIKALFIFQNDAHNYKITGILKHRTPAQQVGMLP
jgi:hypothetical protein